MAQGVRRLPDKAGDLSLIPRIHIKLEGRTHFTKCFSDFHIVPLCYEHPQILIMHPHTEKIIIRKPQSFPILCSILTHGGHTCLVN